MNKETARRLGVATLAGLALLASACVTSLHPFYREQDVAFDPALVGVWVTESGEETWEFSSSDRRAYRLRVGQTDGPQAEFTVHLFRLGAYSFLDLLPNYNNVLKNELLAAYTAPTHAVMRVYHVTPALEVAHLNFDAIKRLSDSGAELPAHVRLRGPGEEYRVVFTADTEELQRFLLRIAANEDMPLFGKPGELKRKAAPQ